MNTSLTPPPPPVHTRFLCILPRLTALALASRSSYYKVPEDSKCSNKCPRLLHFSIQWNKKGEKMCIYINSKSDKHMSNHTLVWWLYHDECLVLGSVIWCWSSLSWSTVTMSKGGRSWASTKLSAVVFSVFEGSCSWPYMSAVNNSNKIWYVPYIL